MATKDIDAAANALANVPGLGDLDAGVVDKLVKLERQILYRSFYFPGGQPKKYVTGVGRDTEDVHYDGHTEERDILSDWDPRYLDDYIQQAKQYGYHKHFLYWDGELVREISFDEAAQKLSFVDENNEKEIFFGILEGLAYMDKIGSFLKDQAGNVSLSEAVINQKLKANRAIIQSIDNKIKYVVGQNKNEFISSDVGWISSSEAYCFAGDVYAQWKACQDEYQVYKEKLWDALKNIDNLNLCTNNFQGIAVGDVHIEQAMNCVQKINDAETLEEANNDNGKPVESKVQPKTKAPLTDLKSESSNNINQQLTTKDDNGVLYGPIAGKSITEIKFKVPDHNIYRYVAVTNADDRCYITNKMEVSNADYTFRTKNIEIDKKVLVDRNGVPYYLNEQAINEKLPSNVVSIVSKEGLPGNMKYLAKLDNGEFCYLAGDPKSKEYAAFDACGSCEYDNIKCNQELIKQYDKDQERSEGFSNPLLIVIIIGIFGIIFLIFIFMTSKKQKVNKKKTTGGYNFIGQSPNSNQYQQKQQELLNPNQSKPQMLITEINDDKNSEFYRQQSSASILEDL